MDDFREYLNRPRDLIAQLNDIDVRAEGLWDACTKVSTTFGSECVRGSGGSSKDGPLAAYADVVGDRELIKIELAETLHEMKDFLTRVERLGGEHGARDAELLRSRYIKLYSWPEVIEALAQAGFECGCLRTVHNWHLGSLERAEQIWEERQ